MSDNQDYLDKVATATNNSYWAHMYDVYGWAFIGGAVIILFGAFLCCRWICQPKDIYKKKPKLRDDLYEKKPILPTEQNVIGGMQPPLITPVQVGQSPQPMFPVAGGGMSPATPKIQISPISPKSMMPGMYSQGMPQFQGVPQYQNQQQFEQMQHMQLRRVSGVSGVPTSHFFPAVPYPTNNLKVPNQYKANFQQKVSITSDQNYIPTSMVDSVFANEGISMAPGAKKATEDRQKAIEVMKKEEGVKIYRIKGNLAKARKESALGGNSNLATMPTLPANNLQPQSSMTFLQRVNALKTDENRKLEEEKEDDLESVVSKAKLSNLSKASSILMSANVVKSTETLLTMGKQ